MSISQNQVVQLHYELRLDNAEGEFVERTDAGAPLTFIFGQGSMIQDFEANLEGKKVGDTFAFGIPAERAYGPVFQEAIMELPLDIFAGHEDLLQIGNMVPMRGEDGSLAQAIVLEVTPSVVVMDFNHPMAGKNLYFSGSIVSVRPATPTELQHGHVHGDGGVEH